MKLIIVESPTKSKTLGRFLGKEYNIAATRGHIRDLPRKSLGISVEKDFDPRYTVVPGRKKTIKELKDLKKKAKDIYLGMDPDREGEAIAWHVSKVLDLKNPKRIVFHEITDSAIKKALQNPEKINGQLVDAQQARRILDRIVGYKLSPFLWRKVVRGLSAGRVQSVVVRLVVERERERKNFVPQEYWSIKALLKKHSAPPQNHQQETEKKDFEAILIKTGKKTVSKMGIKNKTQADNIIKDIQGAKYKVADIKRKEQKKNPYPPFKTSTLQQEAWKKFRFPAKFTMGLAQNLYERGLITYHRSDSLNLSQQSLLQAKQFIINKYGENYWSGSLKRYKTKSKTAQEAHEAVRPTYPEKTPVLLSKTIKENNKIGRARFKLYDLIWRRFMASQMAPAVFNSVRADINALPKEKKSFPSGLKSYLFRTTGRTMKFDGFLKVYSIKIEENELPSLEKKELLTMVKLIPSQHFTQPPARYTEAGLIKTLEKNGIGRPSTYAPIISTVQERNYIKKNEKRRFCPTEIGTIVNDLLVEHFPKIVDVNFTAQMEEDLDKIAGGKKQWVKVIKDFYGPFQEKLNKKEKEVPHKKETYEKTKKKCPQCGASLLIKLGKYGKFYACSNFPKCKYTEPLEKNVLGIKCPKCKKGELLEKRTKRGKIFYGCSNWPDCDFALWNKPIKKTCPKCGSLLTKTKRGTIKCSNQECKHIEKQKNSAKMK